MTPTKTRTSGRSAKRAAISGSQPSLPTPQERSASQRVRAGASQQASREVRDGGGGGGISGRAVNTLLLIRNGESPRKACSVHGKLLRGGRCLGCSTCAMCGVDTGSRMRVPSKDKVNICTQCFTRYFDASGKPLYPKPEIGRLVSA